MAEKTGGKVNFMHLRHKNVIHSVDLCYKLFKKVSELKKQLQLDIKCCRKRFFLRVLVKYSKNRLKERLLGENHDREL